MKNTVQYGDLTEINVAIEQMSIQLLELTVKKQELEKKKQERHLCLVK